MKDYSVRPYETKDYPLWNSFINEAKNATFLFHRDFMEYHKDRFDDFSLMVFDKEKLVAVLPANRVGDAVFSHQGLTYGGVVIDSSLMLAMYLSIYYEILRFLNVNNIEFINFKSIPSIYCSQPSEEINYALFLSEAKLTRRDALATINLKNNFKSNSQRKTGVKRAKKLGLEIKIQSDFSSFWNAVLIPNLFKKYNTKPVHTLAEITQLQQKFPNNILQYNVYHNNEILAGVTLFVSKNTVHTQYIAGIGDVNKHGALDFLFDFLITTVFANYSYFDFGISNENEGKNINKGLQYWKETFGARTFTQDFYEVKTSNYNLLDEVIL